MDQVGVRVGAGKNRFACKAPNIATGLISIYSSNIPIFSQCGHDG